MMCYKDRTFCPGDGCANRQGCTCFASNKVREAAYKFGLSLALFDDHTELECYKPEPTKEPKQ